MPVSNLYFLPCLSIKVGKGDHVCSRVQVSRISEAFRMLLPQATRLVALHFQRTLVNRAIERMRAKGEGAALESAIAALESSRLEIQWR